MKLTTARLKKLINEEIKKISESEITKISHADVNMPDPNDDIFKIIDLLMNRALKKMGKTDEDVDDGKMSKLSNEVVTKHLQMMIDELIQKYNEETSF